VKAGETVFRSLLAAWIGTYLSAKRAVGCRFDCEERALRLFDRFLVERAIATPADITSDLIDVFLASRARPQPRSHNHLLGVVRRLFDWLAGQGVVSASPVSARPRRETARRLPFLFDPGQARLLLTAAGQLPDRPKGPCRGVIYRAVFALLYGLGLRVGEVSRLRCGDVDLDRDLLLIRDSKFGKSRLVPFGPRLAAMLREYVHARRWPLSLDAPLFTFDGRRPIHTNSIRNAFRDHLVPRLGFTAPSGTSKPRVHDLRHSFAVGALLRWYREGLEAGDRLQHLSTFLGHLNPHSTAVYLTITADLLQEANRRFEAFAAPIAQERTS
jgi:site-specific recombinase XerD